MTNYTASVFFHIWYMSGSRNSPVSGGHLANHQQTSPAQTRFAATGIDPRTPAGKLALNQPYLVDFAYEIESIGGEYETGFDFTDLRPEPLCCCCSYWDDSPIPWCAWKSESRDGSDGCHDSYRDKFSGQRNTVDANDRNE